jgi:hypothetical protein
MSEQSNIEKLVGVATFPSSGGILLHKQATRAKNFDGECMRQIYVSNLDKNMVYGRPGKNGCVNSTKHHMGTKYQKNGDVFCFICLNQVLTGMV